MNFFRSINNLPGFLNATERQRQSTSQRVYNSGKAYVFFVYKNTNTLSYVYICACMCMYLLKVKHVRFPGDSLKRILNHLFSMRVLLNVSLYVQESVHCTCVCIVSVLNFRFCFFCGKVLFCHNNNVEWEYYSYDALPKQITSFLFKFDFNFLIIFSLLKHSKSENQQV